MTHKTVPVGPTAEMIAAIEGHLLTTSRGAILNIKSGLKAAIEAAPPSPVTELEAMLYEALRAFRDGGPEGGTDFNGWHQSYEEPCRLAREALAAYEAKKEGV